MGLLLTGCQAAPKPGVWVGRREVIAPPGADPEVVNTVSLVRLEVSADGAFTLIDQGFTLRGRVEGNRLRVTEREGRAADGLPVYQADPMSDGGVLLESPDGEELALSPRSQPSDAPQRKG